MTAETKVGLFTFLGIVLLGLSIFMLGNFTISSGYDIKVYFQDVSGLPAKSNVRLNGVEVGKVKDLKITNGKVLAIVRINEGVVIFRDSKFMIAATSLIGTNYLQIDQGHSSSGVIKEGDTIQGISMPSISDMITQTLGSLQNFTNNVNDNGRFGEDLNATLENLRELSGNINELVLSLRPYLASSMQNVSELTKTSKEFMDQLDSDDGLFKALTQDKQMASDVKSTLANVRQVSEDAKQFIGRMARFRLFWMYEARFQPNGGFTESDLSIKFLPRDSFMYYRAGVADMGNRDNLPKNDRDYRGKPNKLDFRLGMYNKWADLNVGMIRGAGGAVVSIKPFFMADAYAIKNFYIYGEGTDFGRNRYINGRLFDKPDISIGAGTWATKNLGFGVRYDDMLEASSFQATMSLSFEDKELAALLGLASLAK